MKKQGWHRLTIGSLLTLLAVGAYSMALIAELDLPLLLTVGALAYAMVIFSTSMTLLGKRLAYALNIALGLIIMAGSLGSLYYIFFLGGRLLFPYYLVVLGNLTTVLLVVSSYKAWRGI